jgi:hypothetical protein
MDYSGAQGLHLVDTLARTKECNFPTKASTQLQRFSRRLGVGGLRLPKVLKNTTNMLSSMIYCHRKLRLWDEGVHDLKGGTTKKDEPVPKL